MSRLKIMFFVEGYTDIRFVYGLSQICDLTLAVPERTFTESGLKARIEQSGARLTVEEIPGSRLGFQLRAFPFLWNRVREFDAILSQEVLRGSFSATIAGALRGVPVVTYMGIAPVEYFRCRRERRQIGWATALLGETVIRALMTVNGRLATRCLAMGPYLRDIAAGYCPRSAVGLYYGVDVDQFRPAGEEERLALRRKHELPPDAFLIFLSSRISHEKDPETVLRATAMARARGLNAVVINLGGGYKDFLQLARTLALPEPDAWVLGRPAVNPMNEVSDYFRCADVMALASLAEGAAFSTLEALSCATPVVCTGIGGMQVQLDGYARLTPRQDAEAMCGEFLWVAKNREKARAQAMRGREYVIREWSREKAFGDLAATLEEAVGMRWRRAPATAAGLK